MKKVSNSKGAIKSPQRTSLEKANLVSLMKNFTLEGIAEMYNTSITTAHSVLTNQLIERSIGCDPVDNEFSQNMYYESQGAWMNSKERQSLINYKSLK